MPGRSGVAVRDFAGMYKCIEEDERLENFAKFV